MLIAACWVAASFFGERGFHYEYIKWAAGCNTPAPPPLTNSPTFSPTPAPTLSNRDRTCLTNADCLHVDHESSSLPAGVCHLVNELLEDFGLCVDCLSTSDCMDGFVCAFPNDHGRCVPENLEGRYCNKDADCDAFPESNSGHCSDQGRCTACKVDSDCLSRHDICKGETVPVAFGTLTYGWCADLRVEGPLRGRCKFDADCEKGGVSQFSSPFGTGACVAGYCQACDQRKGTKQSVAKGCNSEKNFCDVAGIYGTKYPFRCVARTADDIRCKGDFHPIGPVDPNSLGYHWQGGEGNSSIIKKALIGELASLGLADTTSIPNMQESVPCGFRPGCDADRNMTILTQVGCKEGATCLHTNSLQPEQQGSLDDKIICYEAQCSKDSDCPYETAKFCLPFPGICEACVTDEHCGEGGGVCSVAGPRYIYSCQPGCRKPDIGSKAASCPAENKYCAPDLSCVECLLPNRRADGVCPEDKPFCRSDYTCVKHLPID